MRRYIVFLGLLLSSTSLLANWQSKVVIDPDTELHQYSLQAAGSFPLVTLSCISVNAIPVDMVQIDRLTKVETSRVERVEIRVDNNPVMVFYPDQHETNIAFNYYSRIETGIETVTMIASNESAKNLYGQLIGQFIKGNRSRARVVTDTGVIELNFSLLGFTKAYLPMRTACLNNSDSIAQGLN